MFSYYGSKSKIVDYYPPPKHKKIIEPFAGSARYSLKYWQNDITIVDKYDVIVKIWKYLQQCEKNDIIDKSIIVKPLNKVNITKLLIDTLYVNEEQIKDLSNLIYNKTLGNPFFVKEFLKTLYSKKLIIFDV